MFGLIAVLLLTVVLVGGFAAGSADAGIRPVPEAAAIAATPVPEGEGRDPLDGDPLDGAPPNPAREQDEDLVELDIVRSGRPSDTPNSLSAYDGDPETVWSAAETEETWLWFDFGEDQRLREVRWLARGGGAVTVALSTDRDDWKDAGERAVRGGWQTIEVTEDARYVRLTLTADEEGMLPKIAEVSARGDGRGESASLAQKAGNDKKRKNNRNTDNAERTRDRNRDEKPVRDEAERGTRAESQPGISVEPGETRCRGKKAKCRAEEGKVSVEEDGCNGEGSCTIDIVADGGTANCDASGGEENKAGGGRGKLDDNGGRCEAIANGGTVTIGDIDP